MSEWDEPVDLDDEKPIFTQDEWDEVRAQVYALAAAQRAILRALDEVAPKVAQDARERISLARDMDRDDCAKAMFDLITR